MPTSHSKRNTTLAFFTAHERSLLKGQWGSSRAVLGRDSFLPFGSCQLCLHTAREPVSCLQGHLFCRECAIADLVAQRKEIARLESERERRKADDEERKREEREEEQERAIREFERVQMGMSSNTGKRRAEDDEEEETKRVKRKFELDAEKMKKSEEEERRRMREQLDEEKKSEAKRKNLANFWKPAELEAMDAADSKPVKLHPLCPCSSESDPHQYSLKTLVSVNFSTEPDTSKSGEPVRSCPACKKALTNATKAVLAATCGHVLCKPCADKFLAKSTKDPHSPNSEESLRCHVCDADLSGAKDRKDKKNKKSKKDTPRGLIEIQTDGTGFAGGGKSLVKKEGVAFQC